MSTILDHPLFKLLPAREHQMYANVTNKLEVSLPDKTVTHHIEIATDLFHLMRFLKVERGSSVLPYLDVSGRSAYFGIMVDEERIFDLWRLPSSELPFWVGDIDHWSFAG